MKFNMRISLLSRRNYTTNDTLELLFSLIVHKRIISITTQGDFENLIRFHDGSTLQYWKRNYPYASWKSGTIDTNLNGTRIKYNWCDNMPSRKLLNKLLKKIDAFIAFDD